MWSSIVEMLITVSPHLSWITDVLEFGIAIVGTGRVVKKLIKRSRNEK